MDPRALLPTLDAAGGVRLPLDRTASRVIAPNGARAVDLLDAPLLEEADLRAAAPGVHVRVEECPRLRHVRLPAEGGAFIHVERIAADEPLWFEGPVADLDARVDGVPVQLPSGPSATSLETGRPAEVPARGAWIQHAYSSTPAPDVEVVLRHGPGALAATACPGARVLLVAGDPEAVEWHVPGHVLRAAAAHARRLGRVTARALEVLDIDGAPSLEHIEGHGTDLRLRGAGPPGETLRVDGSWVRLRASSSPVATLVLRAPLSADSTSAVPLVELHDCARLRRFDGPPIAAVTVTGRTAIQQADGRIELRVRAEELRRALDAGANPTALLRSLVLGRGIEARTRRAPRDLSDALQLLAALAERGADVEECWALRDRLAKRYAGGVRWRWPFKDLDLADRAWLADIALWEAARGAAPAAREFDAVLRRVATILQVRLLLVARAERAADGRPHAILDDVLLHIFRNNGVSSERTISPRQVVHPLVAARYAPNGDALADAACAWLGRMKDDGAALDALQSLLRHGVTQARLELAEIATGSGRWSHDARQRALRAVLAEHRRDTADASDATTDTAP
jgi:hypothetical protein